MKRDIAKRHPLKFRKGQWVRPAQMGGDNFGRLARVVGSYQKYGSPGFWYELSPASDGWSGAGIYTNEFGQECCQIMHTDPTDDELADWMLAELGR
jgi:hypothetical protein